jgi:hypothetical protein
MGGKRIGLARTQALIENLKRELSMSGSTLKGAKFRGDLSVEMQDLSGDGLQSGSIAKPRTMIQDFGHEVVTTYQIDLQNLSGSSTAGTCIGKHNATTGSDSYAYMFQWDTSTNGLCYKIDLNCIEAPAGGAANAAFVLSSSTYGIYEHGDVPAADPTGIVDFDTNISGNQVISMKTLDNSPPDDEYLYLTCRTGTAAASAGQYTAGKLVFKFYSYKSF